MQRAEIAALARADGFPRVSIYLPTHVRGPEIEQAPIRLRNALREVRGNLSAAGLRNGAIEALLAEAQRRSDEPLYWRYQERGLAVFIEEGATHWFRLPEEPPAVTTVGARYQVRPLLGIFGAEERFYVLQGQRRGFRLLRAGARTMDEVPVEDLPTIEDVRAMTEFDADVGYHARSARQSMGGTATPRFHSLGPSPEDYDEVLLTEYVRAAARAIDAHLPRNGGPLVIAGGPRMVGRLRQVLQYRPLAEKAILQGPAFVSDQELHAQARAIVEPLLRTDYTEACARLEAFLDGASVVGSTDLGELLRAAFEGRIEVLFLDPGETIRGTYDETSHELRAAREREAGSEDLLDRLAVVTLSSGGEAFVLPKHLRPRAGPAAAILRY